MISTICGCPRGFACGRTAWLATCLRQQGSLNGPTNSEQRTENRFKVHVAGSPPGGNGPRSGCNAWLVPARPVRPSAGTLRECYLRMHGYGSMTISNSARSPRMQGSLRACVASWVPLLLCCAALLCGCAEGYPDPGEGSFMPQGVAATAPTPAATAAANLQTPPAGLSANPAAPVVSPWTSTEEDEDTPAGLGLPLGSTPQPPAAGQMDPNTAAAGDPNGTAGMSAGDPAAAAATLPASAPAAAANPSAGASPSCQDGVLNGTETDVDCGGGCNPCDLAGSCVSNADCEAGLYCDGGRCQAPPVPPASTQPAPAAPPASSTSPAPADSFTCGGDSCNDCGGGLTNCCTLLDHCGCSLLSNGRLCLLRPPAR